jgi:hypothetical protein
MEKLFKSEQKTPKHIANNTPKEVVEKTFILNFFKELPIESLKKLINFQEIDFENSKLWEDPKKRELLSQLRDENVVKYTCELSLYFES